MGLESCAERLCTRGPRGLPLYPFGLFRGFSGLVCTSSLVASDSAETQIIQDFKGLVFLMWLDANYITLPAQGADVSLNMSD